MARGNPAPPHGASRRPIASGALERSKSPPSVAVNRFVVSVLPEAEADIREAFPWYRERSALAANGFRTEVLEAIDELTVRASIWPRDEDGVHHRVMKRFPYTVHYEIADSVVTVFAVAHHRRLPDDWQYR